MPTTSRGYPYPSGAVGVPPDVPGDIYKLALAVNTDVTTVAGAAAGSAPTAWTPHYNFATVGNGINVGIYWYTAGGRILNGKFDWTWGSTSTMATTASTPFTVDLPAGEVAVGNFTNVGSGSIKDVSVDGVFHTDLLLTSTTRIQPYLAGSASGAVVNDGTPFTFAAGDHVSGTFSVYIQ